MSHQRAVGFCDNSACKSVHKGVFLMDYGNTFLCPVCTQEGWIEMEKRLFHGLTGPKEDALYREVRLHFDFQPLARRYNSTAIVSISGLEKGAVHEIFSPLIMTERRALMVAEFSLCAVNSGSFNADGSQTAMIIDLCASNWKRQIEYVSDMWSRRERRIMNATKKTE